MEQRRAALMARLQAEGYSHKEASRTALMIIERTNARIEWHPVGDGTPLNAWLETKRDGEEGTTICMCRLMTIGDEPEWIEKDRGRTTVTHHSFLAPTHWRWLTT